MVEMHTPPLEIVLRVTLVYVALVLMVRLAGKREIGQLAPLEIALRKLGVERLATVRRAAVEPDGSISAIPLETRA